MAEVRSEIKGNEMKKKKNVMTFETMPHMHPQKGTVRCFDMIVQDWIIQTSQYI